MDLREICLDEIALEGLDGITVPTLWLRLENHQPPVKTNPKIKEYLWGFIVQHEELRCYQLPKKRPEPDIFDRFAAEDNGWIPNASAPDELDMSCEVYSSNPMCDSVNGIRGACSDCEKRIDVTEEISSLRLTLEDSRVKYGPRKLVIVASQSMRERSLLCSNANPNVLLELTDVAYAVLERLGRSRWQGDLQAVLDKKVFTEKSYHIHYVMKKLFKQGLVVKHQYTYKREDKNNRAFFQVLIHLARFGRDCRSSMNRTMDMMRDKLEAAPNMTMNLGSLRESMSLEDRHFKTLYNSMVKNGFGVIENIDPAKKPKGISGKRITLVKNFNDDDDEDDDVTRMLTSGSDAEFSPMVLEQPTVYQSFGYVLKQGKTGLTQRQMLQFLKGYGKLEARNVCRSFERLGVITTILVDRGRQRSQNYIAKNFAKLNISTQEFTDEKKKMRQLLSESSLLSTSQNDSIASSKTNIASEAVLEVVQTIAQETQSANDEPSADQPAADIATGGSVTSWEFNPESCSSPRPIFRTEPPTLQSPVHTQQKKWDANLTTRKIKRHNTILELLNQEKVIEGYTILQKVLTEKEEEDGVKTKIDKKTVKRLVAKMHDDGFLQHHIIPIAHEGSTREFHLVVSLDCGPKRLRCALDTAKYKMLSEEENKAARKLKKPKKTSKRQQSDKSDCNPEPPNTDLIDYSITKRSDPNNSFVIERYQPKFKRLRIVHQLLYYLMYEHPHLEGSLETSDNDDVITSGTIDLDKVHVYNDEYTWKRFLPPAPVHNHSGHGWLQLGDVAVTLPITVLCQFHRIGYEVAGLESWLAHPEQRFCLLRHLPAQMRSLLLYKRKYIYSLMVCIEQLAFMGLVSMRKSGFRKTYAMPKENMMIHVHKKAAIYDTRASSNGHFKVEDKCYERIDFDLTNGCDVDSYWYKLQDICLKTPIGCLHLQDPDYANIKEHLGTLELRKFLSQAFQEETKLVDNGDIPGDHRGAGGLDSSLYSYLFRNWTAAGRYKYTQKKPKALPVTRKRKLRKSRNSDPAPGAMEVSQERLPEEGTTENTTTSPRRGDFDESAEMDASGDKNTTQENESRKAENDKSPHAKIVKVNNVGRNERVKGGKGVKRKTAASPSEVPEKKKPRGTFFRKRRLKTKKITVKKQRLKYTDERDLEAIMSRKGKTRVQFSHAEDSLLLICHVANTIMIRRFWRFKQDPRRSLISWIVIRDIMQTHLQEARDKTSVSFGRRTRFLMKNQDMRICHDICVTDALSDKKMIAETLPTLEEYDQVSPERVTGMYRELVDKLRIRFQTAPGVFLGEIPESIDEISSLYSTNIVSLKRNHKSERRSHFTDEINTLKDINCHSLENVIYVALKMNDDEFSIYQAFRTFEHFPSELFTNVFTLMKLSGLISSKLEARRSMSMSFGVPSHKLSFGHQTTFKANVPQEALTQLWNTVCSSDDAEEMKIGIDATFGHVFHLCQLLWDPQSTEVRVDIPDQIILPDMPGNSIFENQFLNTMKEVREEIAAGTLQVPEGSYPSSLIAAASRLLKESPAETRDSSDDEEKQETNSKSNKLGDLMKMYQRHPSYTNWLLLIDPGKRAGQDTESKFGGFNYAINSDNVALKPCEVTIKTTDIPSTTETGGLTEKTAENVLLLLASRKYKRNDVTSSWEQLTQQAESLSERDQLETIFNVINKEQVFGLKMADLHHTVRSAFPTTDDHIQQTLEKLIKLGVVYTVGVNEKRLVTHKNIQPWLATGYRFTGARSKYQDEVAQELLIIKRRQLKKPGEEKEAIVVEDNTGTATKENGSTPMEVDLAEQEPDQKEVAEGPSRVEVSKEPEEVSKGPDQVDNVESKKPNAKKNVVWGFKSFNERVQYICRPWHSISGGINHKTAKLVLSSVFLKVISSPGITVDKLCASYDFQHICILEMVDLLCETGCLVEHTVNRAGPPRLFGGGRPTQKVRYLTAAPDASTKVAAMCNILEKHAKQEER